MKQIITISHQYGSAGRFIGTQVAKQLGIPCYDVEIIAYASQKSGIPKACFLEVESFGNRFYSMLPGAPFHLALQDEVYLAQHQAIQELAKKGPCVMIGHGACEILKEFPDVIRIFIYAELEDRKKRLKEEKSMIDFSSNKAILESDMQRSSYYHFYHGSLPFWTEHFDLCLNSSKLGVEKIVQTLLATVA